MRINHIFFTATLQRCNTKKRSVNFDTSMDVGEMDVARCSVAVNYADLHQELLSCLFHRGLIPLVW